MKDCHPHPLAHTHCSRGTRGCDLPEHAVKPGAGTGEDRPVKFWGCGNCGKMARSDGVVARCDDCKHEWFVSGGTVTSEASSEPTSTDLSDFGWWARFEDEDGSFGWLTSSYRDSKVPYVYTEDPENAYRFATAAEAQKAIEGFRLFPGGAWEVVEHKDEGMGDDRNADHMQAEIERSERAVADGTRAETALPRPPLDLWVAPEHQCEAACTSDLGGHSCTMTKDHGGPVHVEIDPVFGVPRYAWLSKEPVRPTDQAEGVADKDWPAKARIALDLVMFDDDESYRLRVLEKALRWAYGAGQGACRESDQDTTKLLVEAQAQLLAAQSRVVELSRELEQRRESDPPGASYRRGVLDTEARLEPLLVERGRLWIENHGLRRVADAARAWLFECDQHGCERKATCSEEHGNWWCDEHRTADSRDLRRAEFVRALDSAPCASQDLRGELDPLEGERAPHEPALSLADRGSEESALSPSPARTIMVGGFAPGNETPNNRAVTIPEDPARTCRFCGQFPCPDHAEPAPAHSSGNERGKP